MRESYKTKQKQAMLDYLASLGDGHTTAAEIAAHLRERGNPIGIATVYRQLEKLAEEGLVKKYNLGKNSGACYQYTGTPGCHQHYHFKCSGCGQVLHVECAELDHVAEHLAASHHFRADIKNTMILCKCEQCAKP